MVSRASTAFDQEGVLTDGNVQKQLRAFLEGFVAFSSGRG
jgi:hypothetical protein